MEHDPRLDINVSAHCTLVTQQTGIKAVCGPDGKLEAIQLADGRALRPLVSFELEAEGDDEPRLMSTFEVERDLGLSLVTCAQEVSIQRRAALMSMAELRGLPRRIDETSA